MFSLKNARAPTFPQSRRWTSQYDLQVTSVNHEVQKQKNGLAQNSDLSQDTEHVKRHAGRLSTDRIFETNPIRRATSIDRCDWSCWKLDAWAFLAELKP